MIRGESQLFAPLPLEVNMKGDDIIMSIAPCPVHGTHKMISQGYCVVRDADTDKLIDSLSGWYQCDCGERFICQGLPHFGWSIGDYCTEGAIKGYGGVAGVWLFQVDSSLIYTTDDSTLPGYRFCTSTGVCQAAG